MVRIAIDGTAEKGTPVTLLATLKWTESRPDVDFTYFAPAEGLDKYWPPGKPVPSNLKIITTSETVTMKDSVLKGMRKKASSLHGALGMVLAGEADGCVSSGNTGVQVALLMLDNHFRLPLVNKIGLAPTMPVLQNPDGRTACLLLDAGATVDTSPTDHLHFAKMAYVYVKLVLGREHPRIALLTNGEEASKGGENTRATHNLLKEKLPEGSFYGNIEADKPIHGVVDAVISPGEMGNVGLKALEEGLKVVGDEIRKEVESYGWLKKRVYGFFVKRVIAPIKKRLDPNRYGGAIFLGGKRVCVKAHGGCNQLGFESAIGIALKAMDEEIIDKVAEALLHT